MAGVRTRLRVHRTVFCLLSLIFLVYVNTLVAFPLLFTILILLLFLKDLLVLLLVYGLSLSCQYLAEFMLAFVVKLHLNGKILGSTLRSLLFVKVVVLLVTSLNSHLSFDLLSRYQEYGCFAGLQFDFAKCFDSVPYSITWSTLKHYGRDPNFVACSPISIRIFPAVFGMPAA